MSTTQKKALWPTLIISALGLSVLAFAATRKVPGTLTAEVRATAAQNSVAPANDKGEDYVRAGRLLPQLRWNLKALGDRLEKPGKERLTMTGTLSRASDSGPVPVLMIMEFPDRLRLELQGVGPHHVITFNGKSAGKVGGLLDQSEEDLIETLVYDTAEHFFGGQSRGTATRFLGEHFRLDGGGQANEAGPFYDVYQTTERIRHTVPPRQQTQLYCFNSDTRLLERISYELLRNGFRTTVEIRIGGWQKVQDQQIPLRVVRLENNQPALTLTINRVAVSPKIIDGAFGN